MASRGSLIVARERKACWGSLFQHGMSLKVGSCFQRGMSLSWRKRIDHCGHGDRYEREEAGHGGPVTGIFCGDIGGRISRMRTGRRTLPAHRSGTQAFWLWPARASGQGTGLALPGANDRLLPAATDATGRTLPTHWHSWPKPIGLQSTVLYAASPKPTSPCWPKPTACTTPFPDRRRATSWRGR